MVILDIFFAIFASLKIVLMVVFPNAKINIGLYVTEKRRDGFHNLETVFYPIDLFDILEIIEKEGKKGECVCKTTGIDIKCDTEANLIVKAYRMLDADFHLPAVEVHLHKLIPFGAGLGGGSADAAFMLKALNDLFGLSLDVVHLKEYATRLGSDCAFLSVIVRLLHQAKVRDWRKFLFH